MVSMIFDSCVHCISIISEVCFNCSLSLTRDAITCENPMMPFKGVLISCFMLFINEVFTSSALFVSSYAFVMSSLARFCCLLALLRVKTRTASSIDTTTMAAKAMNV